MGRRLTSSRKRSETRRVYVVCAGNLRSEETFAKTSAVQVTVFTKLFITATFKKARKQLIDSYLNDIIDDEEFVLLYDAHFSKNPEFPYKEYERFAMGEIDNVK